jgi:hypothetical protein
MIVSIILISFTLGHLYSNIKPNKVLMMFVTLAIFAIIIWFSMFNLYLSPIVKQVNQQVTNSEYLGMSTFYQYRDESYQILEYGLSQKRMYDAIYGVDYPKLNIRYSTTNSLMPPDHFSYTSRSSLGTGYYDSQYFILTKLGKYYYQNMYPEFQQKWRFYPADFEQLNFDASVQQIYKNGNLDVRLIG